MHITEFTTEQLYAALVHRAKAIMEDAGVTVDDFRMSHIVSHTHVRNAKICAEYIDQVYAGVKAEAVMFDLADKYGLSYGTVNKIVHAQR